MSTKVCAREVIAGGAVVDTGSRRQRQCQYPRMKGKQQCGWHWLLKQSPDVQASYAAARRRNHEGDVILRIPSKDWPDGERWCAGCQSYVPLFYVTGSRCKSCASVAAHSSRVKGVYGISEDEYLAMLAIQGGRCFICQRVPRSKRLAVDHDHETGEVRGLLCADSERGCNHAILGNIKDVAMARRILLYLAKTPYRRIQEMQQGGSGALTYRGFLLEELARLDEAAQQGGLGTGSHEAPF